MYFSTSLPRFFFNILEYSRKENSENNLKLKKKKKEETVIGVK